MSDIGPFPMEWLSNYQGQFQINPWFPLPSNLINKGEQWVPEIQVKATVHGLMRTIYPTPIAIRHRDMIQLKLAYSNNRVLVLYLA
jgi:hypothetical protein